MSVLVLLAVSLLSAVAWHRYCAVFGTAVLGATATSTVVFQLAATWRLGHADKFVLVAVVVTAAVAFVISLLVGMPFRARRRGEAASE